MRKIVIYGIGEYADSVFFQLKKIPNNIKIVGVVDSACDKWGKAFNGSVILSPSELGSLDYDIIYIMSVDYVNDIKNNHIKWFDVAEDKIADYKELLKELLVYKYKDCNEKEIVELLLYWKDNNLSVFNHWVNLNVSEHEVQWDRIENLPYIIYEDKKIYYPSSYIFDTNKDGKAVVKDFLHEQQLTSPHLYISDDITVERGDVIADGGACEGDFSIRYIEKASKVYLFECDPQWRRPLMKTFEPFKDKVKFIWKYLNQFSGHSCISLDDAIDGKLDFLKMDIEGAETVALFGAKNVLSNNDVKCSICSYHKHGDEEAIKMILESYGYTTNTSSGYMVLYEDWSIWSSLDLRRGIVYGRK